MGQSAAPKDDSIRRATYQDVLDAPAHLVAEVLDGTLHTHPRPATPQGLAILALGTDLSNPFQFGRGGPGGWWIAFESELHFCEKIVVPDLAGWRRERMPEYPQTAYVVHPLCWLGLGVRVVSNLAEAHGPQPCTGGFDQTCPGRFSESCYFNGYEPSKIAKTETASGQGSAGLHGGYSMAEGPGDRPQVHP